MTTSAMAFLFLDEGMYKPLDLASLTGVLVPLEAYGTVRDEMCRLVWEVLSPEPKVVPAPIELHGRNLLPELASRPQAEADKARLHVLARVTSIINAHRLCVLRVAYLNRTEIAAFMQGDSKLYGLNFFAVQTGLQDMMAKTLVVPVMDGVPNSASSAKKAPAIDPSLIRAFASSVRWIHHMRQHALVKNSISLRNAQNLAEPLFGDSSHATLLQLADLVSHLLLQIDRDDLETPGAESEYRKSVVQHARALNPDQLSLWRGRMEVNAPAAAHMQSAPTSQ
jgi:hypothetical protein